MLTSRICAYCNDSIPEDRRLGSAYCNDAHKQAAYRKRVKLNHDTLYLKVDGNTAIVAVPANRLVTENCTCCPSMSLMECQPAGDRRVLLCVECQTVMRKRK